MLPPQLTALSFSSYPPPARQLAVENLLLLQTLPLAFTPFLLKEIVGSNLKFPAELRELTEQLAYLNRLSSLQRAAEMKPFAGLSLNSDLAAFDWVNSPGQFLEQLSAHLWATHQMDTFRTASESYVQRFHATLKPQPLPAPRAGVVVIGDGIAGDPAYRLFVKLQREGTLFTQVRPDKGISILRAVLEERAQAHPAAYAHWYVDGAFAAPLKGFSSLGYQQLDPLRSALNARMLAAYQAPHFDPELLRTTLARTTFESLGVASSGDWPLDHFSLSLLTEGSGTQIYSTTFVQWAAREALRRAQPLTLYARYAPRQRERSMDELLGGGTGALKLPQTDPMGSLIDGDLGAYYTWLNQQRLPAADDSRFLVWLENQNQVMVIAPQQKRGFVDHSPVEFEKLVRQVLLPPGHAV